MYQLKQIAPNNATVLKKIQSEVNKEIKNPVVRFVKKITSPDGDDQLSISMEYLGDSFKLSCEKTNEQIIVPVVIGCYNQKAMLFKTSIKSAVSVLTKLRNFINDSVSTTDQWPMTQYMVINKLAQDETKLALLESLKYTVNHYTPEGSVEEVEIEDFKLLLKRPFDDFNAQLAQVEPISEMAKILAITTIHHGLDRLLLNENAPNLINMYDQLNRGIQVRIELSDLVFVFEVENKAKKEMEEMRIVIPALAMAFIKSHWFEKYLTKTPSATQWRYQRSASDIDLAQHIMQNMYYALEETDMWGEISKLIGNILFYSQYDFANDLLYQIKSDIPNQIGTVRNPLYA